MATGRRSAQRRKGNRGSSWLPAVAIILALLVVGLLSSSTVRLIAVLAAVLAVFVAVAIVYVRLMRRRRGRFNVKTLGEFLALTPTHFELAVGEVLGRAGYRDVRHVGGARDLGADLLCRDKDGKSVAVQCKRHAPGIKVGSPDLQAFIGMITVHHGVDRGLFVTTSEFSGPAAELADRYGVKLIDGPELSRMADKFAR